MESCSPGFEPDNRIETMDEKSDVWQTTHQILLTPEDDRRILRRIDTFLLPQLALGCFFAGLDKAAMPHAAILGLLKDLHMVGHDYSWANTIFFFGFLAFSYPISILLVKRPVGKFLSFATIAWAIITICTVSAHNAGGLQTTRFFLGFCEAAYIPSTMVIITMFYKSEEQPLRLGLWIYGNLIAAAVGNIIPAAVTNVKSIAPWKVLYLACGIATIVWGVIMWFTLPNSPMTACFLNEKDRAKAVLRVKDNKTGIKNDTWKKSQFIDTITDLQAWMIFLLQLLLNIIQSGSSGYASIIIQGMGFSTVKTFLVQLINVAVQAISIMVTCILLHYFKNTRIMWCLVGLIVALAGTVMVRFISNDHKWTRYIGFCLIYASTNSSVMLYSLLTANMAGFTRKTTANAMLMIAFSIGGLIGPQIFFAREAPYYPSGFIGIMVCYAILIVIFICLRFYLMRENRRRDRLGVPAEVVTVGNIGEKKDIVVATVEFDKTDREIPEFRYVY